MQKDDHRGQTWRDHAASAAQHINSRVLFVEDVPDEVELAVHQLQKNGIGCAHQCVETESHQLREALRDFRPDLMLSDFRLPRFDGQSALRIAHDVAPDIPFVFLCGTIGEERAIEALLHGAADYVLKDNIKRLAPAVRRALERCRDRYGTAATGPASCHGGYLSGMPVQHQQRSSNDIRVCVDAATKNAANLRQCADRSVCGACRPVPVHSLIVCGLQQWS